MAEGGWRKVKGSAEVELLNERDSDWLNFIGTEAHGIGKKESQDKKIIGLITSYEIRDLPR